MKITKEWLKEQRACEEGYRWFVEQDETDLSKVLHKLLKDNRFDWSNWTIVRVMDLKQKRQYAVFAAEQVLDIFEKEYPKDDRPRKAIEAAKKVIENDTEENRNAAYAAAAASTAAYAAYAAYAAVYAANAATATAAYANAVYATNAAVSAADAFNAAAAAAYAANAANAAYAANAAIKKKIIEYGIGLLGEVKPKGELK